MYLVSWNVNGIRACLKKGFMDYFNEVNADVFCIQETKCQVGQVDLELDGYHQYWNQAVKKGYSGTASFSKQKALSAKYKLGIDIHDNEGRIVALEYEKFYLVNVYTPNSQSKLARLEYREKWEDDFKDFILDLESKKPVIICGDLNVAHNEIDLENPSANRKNAGFSDEEREKFTKLLEAGYLDSFRFLFKDKEKAYTWWSYRTRARDRNVGWRIDYFVVSNKLKDKIITCGIHNEILGSDHCPVFLEIDL